MHPKILLNSEILNLVAEIDEFKGHWNASPLFSAKEMSVLRRLATIESVGSSIRIEGAKLTNREIEGLFRERKTKSLRNQDEQEIAGYAEVIDLIVGSYPEITFTENYLKQFHKVLLKYSQKDERHLGDYKKFSNSVEAYGPDRKSLGIVFETASPFETPLKMKELVEWTNLQFHLKDLHPLITISIFMVFFLQIHPFQDGNGRMSRLLTTYFLLKNGYSYVPYSSMERVIEENKDNYYLSLRKAQATLGKSDANLSEWIIFFLHCMRSQKIALESKSKSKSKAEQKKTSKARSGRKPPKKPRKKPGKNTNSKGRPTKSRPAKKKRVK